MPKHQTKTPTEKAQIALERADQHLAKQRERLAKIAAKSGALKAKLDAVTAEHDTLQNEIAFSQRSRDLLATHPLLGGAPQAVHVEAPEEAAVFEMPTESDEIDGQTSIEDFTAPEPAATPEGIRVVENEYSPLGGGVFAAVPDFDADAKDAEPDEAPADADAPFEL